MRTEARKKTVMLKRLHFIPASLLLFGALALPSAMAGGQEARTRQDKPGKPAAQLIICEREYINFAFGRVRRGIYVDREGGVYSYAYKRGDPMWPLSKDGTFTEEELLEKYSHDKKLVAKVKRREVNAKRKLILKASAGPYTEKIRQGADQGTYSSTCYLYDAATARYREIRLRTTGDVRYENLSEEAKTLSAWLDSLPPKSVGR